MTLQVLISTLNNEPRTLVKKMRLDSDAIIINQCSKNSHEHFKYHGHKIHVVNTTDRGIGRSREFALMLADADIILFADDDEVLAKDYAHNIMSEFNQNPQAEFLVFNIQSPDKSAQRYRLNSKAKRIRLWNCLKYGATRFAVKRESVLQANVRFDEDFGAAKYARGEDSIFIVDCIRAGIKVYSCPTVVASIQDERGSTWFKGFDQAYYKNTGAIFGRCFGLLAPPLLLADAMHHRSLSNLPSTLRGCLDYCLDPEAVRRFLLTLNPLYCIGALFIVCSNIIPSLVPLPSIVMTIARLISILTIFSIGVCRFHYQHLACTKLWLLCAGIFIFNVVCWAINEHFIFSKSLFQTYFLPLIFAIEMLIFWGDYQLTYRRLRRFLVFIIFVCLFACLYNCLSNPELFIELFSMQSGYDVKMESFYDNRNSYALLLYFGILASSILLMKAQTRSRQDLFVFCVLIFLAFNLFITFSRAALLITAITIIAGAIYILCHRSHPYRGIIKWLALFATILTVTLLIIPSTRDYLFTIVLRLESGLTHRNEIYAFAMEYVSEHSFLIGGGFSDASNALATQFVYNGYHNVYLTILTAQGAIGLILYLYILYRIITMITRKQPGRDPVLFMSLVAILTYLFYSFFESRILFTISDLALLLTTFCVLVPYYYCPVQLRQGVSTDFGCPKVSVIIPTYNRPDALERALASVFHQTYPNLEIVVVDDNTNNAKMRERTAAAVAIYPDVQYIQNHQNLGGGETRNVGIRKAKGELIAFLDDDDEFLPTKIEQQVRLYQQKKLDRHKVGVIYCYEYLQRSQHQRRIIFKDHEGNALFEHLCFFTMPTSTWLCSKKALEVVGGFDQIASQQDLMLLMRLLAAGFEIFRVPEPLAVCNAHAPGDGISRHGEEFIAQVKHYHNECRKKYGALSSHQQKLVEYSFQHRLFNCYLNARQYYEAKQSLVLMLKTYPLRKRTIESCIKWLVK